MIEKDIADLLPTLEKNAAEQLADARKQLAKRGEEEAKSLASLLENQRARIAKASTDADKEDPNQFALPGVIDEERRERASDRRHWATRLERLKRRKWDEPARVRASYEVRAHRLEPVGIVYLWPLPVDPWPYGNFPRSRFRMAGHGSADRPRRRRKISRPSASSPSARRRCIPPRSPLIEADTDKPALPDPWAFFAAVLGWEALHVAGSPGGPPVPDDLLVRLPEHDTTLAPTWAVRELDGPDRPFQLLVSIEPAGVDLDKRGSLGGWEATPHQRFERLLRETEVFAGVMIADQQLRVVYAPRGETSGWLSFPIRELATVAGRPMLGGLKLLLDSVRLFTDAADRRLPALLRRSRLEQAAVSTALAEQVLGALHELLRGLDAADPDRIRALATKTPAISTRACSRSCSGWSSSSTPRIATFCRH